MLLEQLHRRATPGWKAIFRERERQQDQNAGEGWTAAHDCRHANGTLALAGQLYLDCTGPSAPIPPDWPWEPDWWKPKEPRRNLERAGALFLAEAHRCHHILRQPVSLEHLIAHIDRVFELCAYSMAMVGVCAQRLDDLSDES